MIPKEPFTVQTARSIYRFGAADNGSAVRDVVREGMPLSFARCKVTSLEQGKSMNLVKIDDSGAPIGTWETTPVTIIHVG